MKDEALRLALEALESHIVWFSRDTMIGKAMRKKAEDSITAIKQALEQERALQALHDENERLGLYKDAYGQPEPEPVAWTDLLKEAQKIVESKFVWKRFIDGTPLANDIACWMVDFAQQHTSPSKREWQGLTDEDEIDWEEGGSLRDLVKAIESKLKEKNNE